MDVSVLVQCDVDRFYGIEYEEFPAQIAQVAMWLIDHQMNQLVSNTFGNYYVRLPLRKSATIAHGNALRIDWQSLLIKETTTSIHADEANLITLAEPEVVYQTVNVYAKKFNPVNAEDVKPVSNIKYDFILGNPPFIGKKEQNPAQKADMGVIFNGLNGAGVLDYVTAWYIKAGKYMQEYNFVNQTGDSSIDLPLRRTLVQDNNEQQTKTAFVSTSSITQGEQVGILWNELFNKYKINIHFAHQTFSWSNEARGNAAVHVVIIGFSNYEISRKLLYIYEDIKGEAIESKVERINPYLVDGKNVFIKSRSEPICKAPLIIKGSEATDDGNLQITEDERGILINSYPQTSSFIRPFLSGGDIINNTKRWCLWLENVSPEHFRNVPIIQQKIELVKSFRLNSPKQRTKEWARFPTLFTENRQPKQPFLVFPKVTSERRDYIPFIFLEPTNIINNTVSYIPNATYYEFGILQSKQHKCWTWYVAGRLESRIQYSNEIVYNNYPWPENPNEKQVQAVEAAAQNVLNARAVFQNPPLGGRGASLADLYDPNTMPPVLVKAHQALDKTVDLCYRPQPFINETKRIEFLFELYDKYVSGMFVNEKKRKTN